MKNCKTCAELVESLKVATALIKDATAQIKELRIDLHSSECETKALRIQLANRSGQVKGLQGLIDKQTRSERFMQLQIKKGITEKGDLHADMIASAIEQALAAPPRPLSKRSKRLGSEG